MSIPVSPELLQQTSDGAIVAPPAAAADRPALSSCNGEPPDCMIALGKLVHELRTPVSGMVGLSRLMALETTTRDTQSRRLALIEQCGEHLLSLVDDIIDLARLRARRLVLQTAPVTLAELLQLTQAVVQPLAKQRGLTLSVTLAPDLPERVTADARRLQQVLLNLLSNAVKFTGQGGVHLHVGFDDDPRRLRFCVSDTGCGMTEAQILRLGRLFERAHEAPGMPDGSGVGLCVTRELVDLMGGELTLHSTPGRGTQFSFAAAFPAVTAR